MTSERRAAIRAYESASLQVSNVRRAARILRNEVARLRPPAQDGRLLAVPTIIITEHELAFEVETGEKFQISSPYVESPW